jgi:hypothetical protein
LKFECVQFSLISGPVSWNRSPTVWVVRSVIKTLATTTTGACYACGGPSASSKRIMDDQSSSSQLG